MKKWLLISILFLTGCSQIYEAPATRDVGVIKLRVEKQIDANTILSGKGSAFAVSPNVVVTALHNLSRPYDILKLNGVPVNILKSVTFGRDGIAIVVDRMPKDVKIYDIAASPAVGSMVIANGYDPVKGLVHISGKLLANGSMGTIIALGMSGGCVTYEGKAIGTVSSIFPALGISVFETLDVSMINELIKENQ